MLSLYLTYPDWIDPFVIKGLPVRWYALMYLVAFFVAYLLVRYQCRNDGVIDMDADETQSLFFYCCLGLLIGARIFSVLFYSDGLYYITHPWMIFWPFRNGHFVGLPGMSYHGGVVGCVIGGWLFSKRYKRSLLQMTDLATAGIPLGYTFGRLGNFINGELFGRVTTSPIGMIFPLAEQGTDGVCDLLGGVDSIRLSIGQGEGDSRDQPVPGLKLEGDGGLAPAPGGEGARGVLIFPAPVTGQVHGRAFRRLGKVQKVVEILHEFSRSQRPTVGRRGGKKKCGEKEKYDQQMDTHIAPHPDHGPRDVPELLAVFGPVAPGLVLQGPGLFLPLSAPVVAQHAGDEREEGEGETHTHENDTQGAVKALRVGEAASVPCMRG